jgi:hypothetical protein
VRVDLERREHALGIATGETHQAATGEEIGELHHGPAAPGETLAMLVIRCSSFSPVGTPAAGTADPRLSGTYQSAHVSIIMVRYRFDEPRVNHTRRFG